MSATNKTTYYELPVFIATDEPKWLTDWNGAMNIIDGAIAEAKTAADNAQTTANANALAISGLSDSVSTISTALGTLTTTVNTLNGTVNTITELIGNGTPTTTDKTIIGAINELKAEIDALAPGGEVDAADVSYNNTTSGLTADDVQEAIDELQAEIEAIQPGGSTPDFNLVTNVVATVTAETGVTVDDSSVNVLTNADSSVGKIYGGLAFHLASGSVGSVDVATITASNLPTITEAYDIVVGYITLVDPNGVSNLVSGKVILHFNTNGSVTIKINSTVQTSVAMYGAISLAPCILFLKDLGD